MRCSAHIRRSTLRMKIESKNSASQNRIWAEFAAYTPTPVRMDKTKKRRAPLTPSASRIWFRYSWLYDSSIVMLLIASCSAGEEFSPPLLRVTGELASVSSTSSPPVSIPNMV